MKCPRGKKLVIGPVNLITKRIVVLYIRCVTKDITRKLLCDFFLCVKGPFAWFYTIYSSDIPLLFEYTILSIWRNCMEQKSICPLNLIGFNFFLFTVDFFFFLLNALRSDILSQNLSFIVFWRFYCNFFWVISWGIDFAHMGVW